MMSEAFIVDAIRTPIGRYGGALSSVRTDDLAAVPLRALIARNRTIDWDQLDEIILGCANQAGEDNRNVARMAGLVAGLPVTVAASTINRLCGSGLDAVGSAARAIRCGEAELVIAGGVESMSRAPFVLPKAQGAFSRHAEIHDSTIGWRFVNPLIEAAHGIDSMPETAETLAAEFSISRQDQDQFALRSQTRALAAQASGRLAEEIIGVEVAGRRNQIALVDQDEAPRATSLEALAALPAPFRAGGSVTAGNASGVNDGACALLLASGDAADRYGLKRRARIVAMATAGVAPRIMGIGPVPATKKLLARQNLTLRDIDLLELNEAFAAQALAVLRQLGIADDADWVNPNGGAIALGHPLGMSGARLVTTALIEMEHRRARRALISLCVGVGQGISLLLEAV
jgi:3-oxoadipyl-CoA thiolase